ncbi:MAG: aminoglycoside phosphotransferase family protein [Chloroflexia bacterium]|nr:aminoglycoside phosphotransferase family protein [Chloroflexia bacterium]
MDTRGVVVDTERREVEIAGDSVDVPTGQRGDPVLVDAAGAGAFLAERFGDGVTGVASAGEGEWSKAFAFRHGGRDWVIRFGAIDEDFQKDRLAARFAAPDLPIPALTEIGRAFAGHYAISERATGAFIDGLDGARMRATLPSLLAMLDAVREVPILPLGGSGGPGGWGGWGTDGTAPYPTWRAALLDVANDRDGTWRERLAASPLGTGRFDEAFGHLDTLLGEASPERCLVHGDLLNRNLLVEGDRVSAVFDWGCGMYGDFLYDLAWFAFWQPWYPAWAGIDFRDAGQRHHEAIGLDVPGFDARFRACLIHIGLAGQAYNAWMGRFQNVEEIARRTMAVAGGG